MTRLSCGLGAAGLLNIVANANYNSNYVPANSGYISPYWPQHIMDPTYKQASLQVRASQTADPGYG